MPRSLTGSEYQPPHSDQPVGVDDDSLLLFSSNPMVRATRRVSLCQPKGAGDQGASPNVHVLSTLEPNVPFLLSCPISFKSFSKVLVGYFLTQVRNFAAVESRHATQRLEEDRRLVEDREERRLHAAVAEAQRALLAEYKHVQRQQKLLNRMAGRAQSPLSPSVAMASDDSDPTRSPNNSPSSPPRRMSTWALVGQEMGLKKAAGKVVARPEEPGGSYNTAEFGRRTILASSKPFRPACSGTRNPPPPTASTAPIRRSCVPRLQHHFHTLDDYQPSNPEVSVVRPYSPAFEAKLQAMQWFLMYPYTGDIRSYFSRVDDEGGH